MPITKELTIRIEHCPGSLGKICGTLADHGVNIMAFQSIPSVKTILFCIVVDQPGVAATVLNGGGIAYTETEVVQVRLANRPGELARAAAKLGDVNINIRYAYCGVDPGSNAPLAILGVTEVGRAATILDQAAAAAAAGG